MNDEKKGSALQKNDFALGILFGQHWAKKVICTRQKLLYAGSKKILEGALEKQ